MVRVGGSDKRSPRPQVRSIRDKSIILLSDDTVTTYLSLRPSKACPCNNNPAFAETPWSELHCTAATYGVGAASLLEGWGMDT
jgi:hypothetical protein